jgi:hypothetical protein
MGMQVTPHPQQASSFLPHICLRHWRHQTGGKARGVGRWLTVKLQVTHSKMSRPSRPRALCIIRWQVTQHGFWRWHARRSAAFASGVRSLAQWPQR